MADLQALPGFDWSRVKWGGPHDPVTEICSYCDAAFREEEVPLRLFGEDRFAGFCNVCSARWFGLQGFDEPPEDDHAG